MQERGGELPQGSVDGAGRRHNMQLRDWASTQRESEGLEGGPGRGNTDRDQVCGQEDVSSGRVRSEGPGGSPGRRRIQWLLKMQVREEAVCAWLTSQRGLRSLQGPGAPGLGWAGLGWGSSFPIPGQLPWTENVVLTSPYPATCLLWLVEAYPGTEMSLLRTAPTFCRPFKWERGSPTGEPPQASKGTGEKWGHTKTS